MPIDLPPPVPPISTPVETLEAQYERAEARGETLQIEGEGFRVLISGPTPISKQRIRDVLSAGKTPSQKVLLLNALFVADDHHLVNVQYARDGEGTIYAHINRGEIVGVEAPPRYRPYFDQFEGRSDLETKDLQPHLLLAGIKADRALDEVDVRWDIDKENPNRYTMQVEAEAQPRNLEDVADVRASIGNPGNRFIGRYFSSGSVRWRRLDGDVFNLAFSSALTGIGDDSFEGEYLDRYDLGYGTVTPVGLFGLSGGYTDYRSISVQENEGGVEVNQFTADIYSAKVNGSQILYASRDHRWLVEESVEYIDSDITVERPERFRGQSIQDERYPAVRIGTRVLSSWKVFGQQGDTSLGFGFKHGLGNDRGTLDDDGNSASGRSGRFRLLDFAFDTSYALGRDFQLTLNAEAQNAIGEKVPQQQQWVLGGPDRLSAYVPGVLVGDSGVYGRLALQLPRFQRSPFATRLSFFVEGGTARFARGENGEPTRAVSDFGVKLEIALTRYLEAVVHSAARISESGISDGLIDETRSDAFFSLTARY